MTVVDNLWYLADEAEQQAERCYHRLAESHEGFREFETAKHVSRPRFETVARRIRRNGAPYGTHTLTYRASGELLLVRHEGVDLWVLPGGQATDDERFREAAKRELREEAGLTAEYDGLGLLGQVSFRSEGYATWGVLPVFEAKVSDGRTPTVADPDDEISDAAFFDELPADTRDREQLERWREQKFS